jgi:hypothetical protein
MNTIVFVGLLLLGAVSLAIAQPYLARRREIFEAADEGEVSAASLNDQLIRLVMAVRDLDFDFDTGKIAEADYAEQRKLLIGRGVSTLMRYEQARSHEQDLDAQIEALVGAFRQSNARKKRNK